LHLDVSFSISHVELNHMFLIFIVIVIAAVVSTSAIYIQHRVESARAISAVQKEQDQLQSNNIATIQEQLRNTYADQPSFLASEKRSMKNIHDTKTANDSNIANNRNLISKEETMQNTNNKLLNDKLGDVHAHFEDRYKQASVNIGVNQEYRKEQIAQQNAMFARELGYRTDANRYITDEINIMDDKMRNQQLAMYNSVEAANSDITKQLGSSSKQMSDTRQRMDASDKNINNTLNTYSKFIVSQEKQVNDMRTLLGKQETAANENSNIINQINQKLGVLREDQRKDFDVMDVTMRAINTQFGNLMSSITTALNKLDNDTSVALNNTNIFNSSVDKGLTKVNELKAYTDLLQGATTVTSGNVSLKKNAVVSKQSSILGKVGVATTTPRAQLDVRGASTFTGDVRISTNKWQVCDQNGSNCVLVYPLTPPAPIDCRMTEWSPWSGCSESCGGGIQTRVRSVLVPAANGGKACESLVASQTCNTQPCR
jgi:hypothetical protein